MIRQYFIVSLVGKVFTSRAKPSGASMFCSSALSMISKQWQKYFKELSNRPYYRRFMLLFDLENRIEWGKKQNFQKQNRIFRSPIYGVASGRLVKSFQLFSFIIFIASDKHGSGKLFSYSFVEASPRC